MQKPLSLNMILRISGLFFFFLYSTFTDAQLTVDYQSLKPEQLVQDVFLGHGIVISNVKYTGVNVAVGQFTNANTPLQMSRGILLTTGSVKLAPGPNNVEDAGYAQPVTHDDPDLRNLLSGGYAIYDATILEFDFIASSNSIQFNYVFASEEYMEWVNSAYNDVFGFFVTGANPDHSQGDYVSKNIAFIPGTDRVVSIDNVNENSYPEYYINNTAGTSIQYDGITRKMQAILKVVPGNIYHIKIAIGDAGDNAYDSGVFLDASSFTSPQCPVGNLNIKPNCAGKETQLALWDESNVTLSANCNGNGSVQVNLTNSDADMAQSAEYRIYNFGDASVTRQNYQLRKDESLPLTIESHGATVLVQADQTPVNPLYIQTNITVKNCGGSAPVEITKGSVITPVSVEWNFGDGTVSSLLNPVHVYALPGNYMVRATFCDTTINQQIRIDACPSLTLLSVCSNNPAETRKWRVRNPNNYNIEAKWQILGTSQQGNIVALSNSDVFFETRTGGTNIAILTVGNVVQSVKLSKWLPCSGVKCDECISSFSPVPGEKYIVSAWVKEDNNNAITYINAGIAFDFEGADTRIGPFVARGAIIDGWQRIEDEFTVPEGTTSITVQLVNSGNNNDVFFDDIRIHPVNSNMKSFVYDPVNLRLMAELDENNYATFYEYDEEGALIRVKKETERGIVTIQESRNNTAKKQ